MSIKSIDDWIELLTDRSKPGDIGEYFSREQCADILGFLNELRECREREYKEDEERSLDMTKADIERLKCIESEMGGKVPVEWLKSAVQVSKKLEREGK